MTRKLRRRETPFFIAVLLLVVAAAVAGISWAGWLAGPENFYGDLWHRLAGVRRQPQHVVIVALDEATLQQYPEPLVCWTPHFARVIEVLRRVGAKIIGLDYLFHVSIESWLQTLDLPPNHPSLEYDEPFKKQLASGQVILAAHRASGEQHKTEIILPIREYLVALPRQGRDLGLINFYNDDDGAIRGYVPALTDDYDQVMLTFAPGVGAAGRGSGPGKGNGAPAT